MTHPVIESWKPNELFFCHCALVLEGNLENGRYVLVGLQVWQVIFLSGKTKSKKAFAVTRYKEGGTERLKEKIHFLLWLAAEKSAAAHWQGTVTFSK